MTTKYQVFVSSTYEDLKDERDQVIRAILEMGHIPVGMEMFSAADEEQWKIISRHIEESDYYVVILAHRYGSKTGGISYSRKEYEYAISCGIPVLGFIIADSASWPADRVDKSPDDTALLDEFKLLVKQKPVSFWHSTTDLYGKFSVALTKAITTNRREGWVRASTAAGPEVTAEITRLSAENARLRNALNQMTRESDREAELSKVSMLMRSLNVGFSYRYSTGSDRSWHTSVQIPYNFLFDLLAPTLLADASISGTAANLFPSVAEGYEDEPTVGFVAPNQVRDLFADWNALDLVMPSDRQRSDRDSEEYWTLAPLGRELQRWQRRRDLMARSARADEDREPNGLGSAENAVTANTIAMKNTATTISEDTSFVG